MTLQLNLPPDLAAQLEARAAATGTAPEKLALEAIRRQIVADDALDRTLAPIRQAFADSGMTEEELSELLEEEKHAMRRERAS
jgi:hypothetical protein